MLNALLVTSLLILTPALAFAQATTPISEMPAGAYTIDKNHTSVTWKVSHMGLSNYTARFTDITATINLDPKDPTKSTLVASINPNSIKTDFSGMEDFDGVLAKGEQWFNSAKFPEIKFESTAIEKTGANTAKIQGNLTMLGATKPVTLTTTFNGAYLKKPHSDAPGMGFSAATVIKRSDWGFSGFIPMIGDDVAIMIETELQKADAK